MSIADESTDEMLLESSLPSLPKDEVSFQQAALVVDHAGKGWITNSIDLFREPGPSVYQHSQILDNLCNIFTDSDPDDSFTSFSSTGVDAFLTPATPLNSKARDLVVAKVERILESQVDAIIAKDRALSVTLNSRNSSASLPVKARTFEFPGKNAQEAWQYTVVIRLLAMIHKALVDGVVITKRDMFYKDPKLFSNQNVVDRYIDDIASTLEVSRSYLNVTAAAKGLVVGAFTIRRDDGSSVLGCSEREGLLISNLMNEDTIEMDNVKWILMVEKEATFHALVKSSFWTDITTEGIVITAKGYPDILSRAFLRLLSVPSQRNNMKQCKVLGLVDYDPDGLGILSTYKYGSANLAHENSTLNIPTICWIGIKTRDILCSNDDHQAQALLKLSPRDRRKASCMLTASQCSEDGNEPEWRREIQIMLLLNLKAEIQFLEACDGGMTRWLQDTMLRDSMSGIRLPMIGPTTKPPKASTPDLL